MSRINIKKSISLLVLPTAMSLMLTGCTLPSFLVTDTGSSKQNKTVKEDYLYTKALSDDNSSKNEYKILKLEKSTFEREAQRQTLQRKYYAPVVSFDLEGHEAKFGDYVADFGDYVEVGDTIATFHTNVDEVGINEAKLRLERLKEDYADACVKHEEEVEKFNDEHAYDCYEYQIAKAKILKEQMDLRWERTVNSYENQISEAQKNYNEISKVGSIYELKTKIAGRVYMTKGLKPGEKVKYGDYVCNIIDSEDVFSNTDVEQQFFGYGMQVTMKYNDNEVPATVVTGGVAGLYGNLDPTKAVFKLDITATPDVADFYWDGRSSMTLNGNTVSIPNVIKVPEEAVTKDENDCYVTVMREDGSFVKTKFIPGGSNQFDYWVLEGLEEGMTIVYK